MAELYFPTEADLTAGLTSAQGQAVVADLQAIATGGATIFVGVVAD